MVRNVVGVMSGSSLDGLDLVFARFENKEDVWTYRIEASECVGYSQEWKKRLAQATQINTYEYLQLNVLFGRFIGEKINEFTKVNKLNRRVDLIGSHGHTTFHSPKDGFSAQLGCGATIAAITGIDVVSDLRAMDVAMGGQGAPIVPMGERYLFSDFELLLNIGGITNVSLNRREGSIAFDICPANRVLNRLVEDIGKEYDAEGHIASNGKLHEGLLKELNELDFYQQRPPKSLANSFGLEVVLPIINKYNIDLEDKLCTYVEHIAIQIRNAIGGISISKGTMLVTGGGAFHKLLIERIKHYLSPFNIEIHIPEKQVVEYKEALIMAFLGLLRIDEIPTTLQSVTGAKQNSVGGCWWKANK